MTTPEVEKPLQILEIYGSYRLEQRKEIVELLISYSDNTAQKTEVFRGCHINTVFERVVELVNAKLATHQAELTERLLAAVGEDWGVLTPATNKERQRVRQAIKDIMEGK